VFSIAPQAGQVEPSSAESSDMVGLLDKRGGILLGRATPAKVAASFTWIERRAAAGIACRKTLRRVGEREPFEPDARRGRGGGGCAERDRTPTSENGTETSDHQRYLRGKRAWSPMNA